eukprot:4474237-Alexandrium_andersonii.AAC.1
MPDLWTWSHRPLGRVAWTPSPSAAPCTRQPPWVAAETPRPAASWRPALARSFRDSGGRTRRTLQ